MTRDWFSQAGYDVRLEWGRYGARRAAERGDILVVIDVLSFTSVVVTAVAHGVRIVPCATQQEAEEEAAAQIDGIAALHRADVPAKGRFSLSPVTFIGADEEQIVTVASPNGATCSRYATDTPCLIAGALLNADAAAQAAHEAMTAHDRPLTVLACGERWAESNEDGELRFALEDYLGAGAVIAHLPDRWGRSPEAVAAETTFRALQADLGNTLLGCGSGIELTDKGYGGDVEHAARLNHYVVAPILQNGCFSVRKP